MVVLRNRCRIAVPVINRSLFWTSARRNRLFKTVVSVPYPAVSLQSTMYCPTLGSALSGTVITDECGSSASTMLFLVSERRNPSGAKKVAGEALEKIVQPG
jgi:hypothetical protein